MKLDFKSNLTLRAKMTLTKKALKAKFDCTYTPFLGEKWYHLIAENKSWLFIY